MGWKRCCIDYWQFHWWTKLQFIWQCKVITLITFILLRFEIEKKVCDPDVNSHINKNSTDVLIGCKLFKISSQLNDECLNVVFNYICGPFWESKQGLVVLRSTKASFHWACVSFKGFVQRVQTSGDPVGPTPAHLEAVNAPMRSRWDWVIVCVCMWLPHVREWLFVLSHFWAPSSRCHLLKACV